jgi:L,D-transpeptidase ErfK/SrfK
MVNLRRAGLALLFLGLPPLSLLLSPTMAAAQSALGEPIAPPQTPEVQRLLDQLLTLSSPVEIPGLGGADTYLPSPEVMAKVHLVIRLSDRRVYVYDRDQVTTSFPVAIGRGGWETPPGQFQVIAKIVDPAWEHPFTGEVMPPGLDNPLGSRWIGFWTDGKNFIGFHGTPNPESVGTPASHGCIRMYDKDVISLFELVQMGTPVEVVP